MAKDDSKKEPEVLNISCVCAQIKTLPTGGHRMMFDAPETEAAAVRQLIGTENRQNYILCLVKVNKDNKPCPSSKKRLIFKK